MRQCDVLALGTKISTLGGRPRGVGPPSVNLGPPNISESKKELKVELKNAIRHSNVLASGTKKIARGRTGGQRTP